MSAVRPPHFTCKRERQVGCNWLVSGQTVTVASRSLSARKGNFYFRGLTLSRNFRLPQ